MTDSPNPHYDDAGAQSLVGKYVLGGITYRNTDGSIARLVQFHGRVETVAAEGIGIRCEGTTWQGELAYMPADLRAFKDASAGEYFLKSTGETVVDPDIVTTWTMQAEPMN